MRGGGEREYTYSGAGEVFGSPSVSKPDLESEGACSWSGACETSWRVSGACEEGPSGVGPPWDHKETLIGEKVEGSALLGSLPGCEQN